MKSKVNFRINIFLVFIIGFDADDRFIREANYSVAKYPHNFITSLSTNKFICLSACIQYNCSYAIHINKTLCELYNEHVFGKYSSDSVAFVRAGNKLLTRITDRILSPSFLYPGDLLKSEDGKFNLILQTDGNLALFDLNTLVWFSKSTSTGQMPYYLRMQNDGNLVIYDGKNVTVWATNTGGKGYPPYKFILQADGNMVVYYAEYTALWDSH